MPSLTTTPPSLPLVAYAESLCQGARVLVVGNARSALVEAVQRRGARWVHVWDSDNERRALAQASASQRELSYGSFDEGPSALREASFDLVLVENLALELDVSAVLAALTRALAPRGAALIAAPNPEASQPLLAAPTPRRALDYYALYDAVKGVLPQVRMLGQVPFVGYALVDFAADGEPSPVLDTSFLPARGEEPDYFVALAGREARILDQYAVVQLPLADVLASTAARPIASPPQPSVVAATQTTIKNAPTIPATPLEPGPALRVRELEQQLAKQEAWIGELEARAEAADARADAAEAELDELREQQGNQQQVRALELQRVAQESETLRQEAHRASRRANDLEDLLQLRDAALKAKETELGESLQALGTRASELQARTQEVNRQRAELQSTAAELQARVAELQAKDAELQAKGAELQALKSAASSEEEGHSELDRLERQLTERSHFIRLLEQQLRESERTGKELLRKVGVEEAGRPPELSQRLARAEAELVTLRWSLELLQRDGLVLALSS